MSVTVLCDLRSRLGVARDQGPRPTCLAFAASDAHAAARSDLQPLSAEWAYYHALQRNGGGPADGATLPAMLDTLRLDGQPYETAWPYRSSAITSSTWKPPKLVGKLFRRASEVANPTLPQLLALLHSGTVVLLTMTLSDAFYRPGKDAIVDASEPVDPSRRHAIVAVAHARDARGDLVLVRNSWGALWGDAGHAWLAESYLVPRIIRLAVMAEEL